MKRILPLFAAAALFATPAFAGGHTMSCSSFASLSSAEKIAEIERLEPLSIEERSGEDASKGSSGPKGTVDPNMLESEKVSKLAAACDDNPDMNTGQAFNAAFSN